MSLRPLTYTPSPIIANNWPYTTRLFVGRLTRQEYDPGIYNPGFCFLQPNKSRCQLLFFIINNFFNYYYLFNGVAEKELS